MRRGIPAILLAALSVPEGLVAQEWTTRFPRAPECQAQYRRSVQPGSSSRLSSLTVRPVVPGSGTVVEHVRLLLEPLDPSAGGAARSLGPVGTGVQLPRFDSLPAGRYQLTVRSIGLARSPDTVVIHAGSSDTITATLFHDLAHFRNEHNCRPRGFRRSGESACVTDTATVGLWIHRVRTYADSALARRLGLIPFREEEIRVEHDERICDRAGNEYGGPGSPPRRVMVLRLGRMYFVYDPFEPEAAGEFDISSFFDLKWKNLLNLAG